MKLPDRLLSRRGAEAMMAPNSILVGGAVAAIGIAVGAPIVGAVGVGALAYAAWVARSIPKPTRGRGTAAAFIDLNNLRDPWRGAVREALDAQSRFLRAVSSSAEGPLKERLAEISVRIDDGVGECWRIALRGQELESALRQLTPAEEVEARIAALRAAPPARTTEGLVEALQGQAESHRRITATIVDTHGRLEMLEARLDESVARAIELSLNAEDTSSVGGLEADVHAVVGEMEALRRGLEATA